MAVDKAEEKIGKRVVNSEEVQQIIKIVENFIKKNKNTIIIKIKPPNVSLTLVKK